MNFACHLFRGLLRAAIATAIAMIVLPVGLLFLQAAVVLAGSMLGGTLGGLATVTFLAFSIAFLCRSERDPAVLGLVSRPPIG